VCVDQDDGDGEWGVCGAREGQGVSGGDNEMYEPFASPLYCERHIFVVLAKKAAKAGIG
jgi:hypothetical protein